MISSKNILMISDLKRVEVFVVHKGKIKSTEGLQFDVGKMDSVFE